MVAGVHSKSCLVKIPTCIFFGFCLCIQFLKYDDEIDLY